MNVIQAEETGAIFALAAGPDGLLCLAACEKGLFISKDGGHLWQQQSQILEGQPVTAVAIAPVLGTPVWLIGVPGGVLRSTPDGQWQTANIARIQPQLAGLAFSPDFARDNVAFAATAQDGVLRSADGGRTFHAWNFGLLDLNTLALALSPNYGRDESLYVGTTSGLFRSRNGGRAWREIEASLPEDVVVLSLAAERGGLTIGSEAHGIWRSRSGDPAWQQLPGTAEVGAVNGLAFAPEDAGTLYIAAEGGVFCYRDGQGLSPVAEETPAALAIACLPDAIIAGSAEDGVWRWPRRADIAK